MRIEIPPGRQISGLETSFDRHASVMPGLMALAWLAGLVASIVLKLWPAAAQLIAVVAVGFGTVQFLAYRD